MVGVAVLVGVRVWVGVVVLVAVTLDNVGSNVGFLVATAEGGGK
jgi:hypothetical protein